MFLLSAMVLATFACPAQTRSEGDTILGKWYAEEGRVIVEMYKVGDEYFGRVDWIDRRNVDTTKVKVGDVLIKSLKYVNGAWKEGQVYSPGRRGWFDCTGRLTTDGKLVMRGHWGIFYLEQVWERAN